MTGPEPDASRASSAAPPAQTEPTSPTIATGPEPSSCDASCHWSGHDVLVVGGGFAGLVLANRLLERAPELDIAVLEAGAEPGGNVRTLRRAGFTAELGPESFHVALEDPHFQWLLALCGLDPLLPDPAAARRYVVRDGRLVKLGLGILLTGRLMSLGGRLRLLCEPFSRGPDPSREESLVEFGERRLGAEATRALLGPMSTGIYAGDPAQLSLPAAFPRFHAMDQTGGLVRSMLLGRRPPSYGRRRIVSVPGGLGRVSEALASRLGERLRLASPARRITRLETGHSQDSSHDSRRSNGHDRGRWQVEIEAADGERRHFRARRLVVTAPAHVAAELLAADGESPLGPLAETLAAIPYGPIAVVSLGYGPDDLTRPIDGFGALAGPDRRPPEQHLKSLGILMTSKVFPERAPDGHHLLRCMVGGVRRPELVELEPEALLEALRPELESLLGVRAAPRFQEVRRWQRGIPQYNLGHGERVATIRRLLAALPGLRLAGNAYHGPGLADTLTRAKAEADELLDELFAERGESPIQSPTAEASP